MVSPFSFDTMCPKLARKDKTPGKDRDKKCLQQYYTRQMI